MLSNRTFCSLLLICSITLTLRAQTTIIKHKLDSAIVYEYDTPSGTWKFDHRSIYEFDSLDRFNFYEGAFWNDSAHAQRWEPYLQVSSVFDVSGSTMREYYHDPKQSKVSARKITYDNLGRAVEKVYLSDTVDISTTSSQEIITYDGNGNPKTRRIFFNVNENQAGKPVKWLINEVFDYSFNAAGRLVEDLNRTITIGPLMDTIYSNSVLRTNHFNTLNQLDSTLRYEWDSSSSSWKKKNKFIYEVDAIGQYTEERGYRWEEMGKTWILNYSQSRAFDSAVKYEALIFPRSYETDLTLLKGIPIEEFYATKPLSVKTLNYSSLDSTVFHYSTVSRNVNTEEIKLDELMLHPNPTDGMIFIKGKKQFTAKFALYGMNGNLVFLEQEVDSRVNLASIPSGVYIYQVTLSNGEEYSGKLIKR